MKWSLKALLWAVACCLMTAQADAQSLFTGPLGDPWKLKDSQGFDYGGWVQVGVQDLNDGAFTGNGFAQNQNEANNLNLNQLYAYVANVADGSAGIDFGFRVDAMYGVDGNEAQSFGNVTPGKWDFLNGFGGVGDPVDHGPYEFAMPQAYGEIAIGDLSVKAGHFYTPIGYEVVTSPNNFFLSRQLTFYNSEPFTHTGFLGTYQVSENLSVVSGWTAGWDTGFTRFNDGSNGVGGFTAQLTENINLAWYGAAGNFGWRGDGTISSGILTVNLTDRLTSVSQLDWLDTNLGSSGNAGFATTGITNNSVGAIQYFFYTLTDRVSLGSRVEWYKADGISYQTYTSGINWKVTPNFIVRPEVRRNDSNGDANDLFNRTVLGVDGIVTF